MNEQQIKASFARHAATPEVSVREYVDSLVEELGDSIAGRYKLYLDTRYWIHLRDAAIPYHDAVFTENPLRVLVTAGNVALDKTFACTVLAKEGEVLDYLRKLCAARV